MRDQTQQEGAILTQVVAHERAHHVVLRPGAIAQAQPVGDELHAIAATQRTRQPDDEADYTDGGHAHDPEPQKHVDLLIVEVDGEDALHRVAVVVAEATHEEVAQRDAREDDLAGLRPVVVGNHVLEDLSTEKRNR